MTTTNSDRLDPTDRQSRAKDVFEVSCGEKGVSRRSQPKQGTSTSGGQQKLTRDDSDGSEEKFQRG